MRRYAASYYSNAASFAGAQPITVVAGQPAITLTFRMIAAPVPTRRHAARH